MNRKNAQKIMCRFFRDRYKHMLKYEKKLRRVGDTRKCPKWLEQLIDTDWAYENMWELDHILAGLGNVPRMAYLKTYTSYGVKGLDDHGISAVEEILRNAPRTTTDMVLYRGLSKEFDEPYVHNHNDIGFISFTFLKTIAYSFADEYDAFKMGRDAKDERKYVLELTIPEGTQCLFLDPITVDMDNVWPEAEILLPTFHNVEVVSQKTEKVKYFNVFDGKVKTDTFIYLKGRI